MCVICVYLCHICVETRVVNNCLLQLLSTIILETGSHTKTVAHWLARVPHQGVHWIPMLTSSKPQVRGTGCSVSPGFFGGVWLFSVFNLFYFWFYVHMWVSVLVCASVCKCLRRQMVFHPLELEIQGYVTWLMWVLVITSTTCAWLWALCTVLHQAF